MDLKEIYQAVKYERLIKKEAEALKAGAIERMDERYKNAVRFLQELKGVEKGVKDYGKYRAFDRCGSKQASEMQR